MENNDAGKTGKVTLRQSMPFDEYRRSADGLSSTAIQELFEGSPIREVRERCIDNITSGSPQDYGLEWVEWVVVQLERVYEPEFHKQVLEWYLKWCVRSHHPRSVRAFRFVCGLHQESGLFSRNRRLLLDLINEAVKINPALYFASDVLIELYCAHFRTFTENGKWVPYTMEQWNTTERYIRRIVQVGDIRWLPFLRDWRQAHDKHSGVLLNQSEFFDTFGRRCNWDMPGHIRAFLESAEQDLARVETKQRPRGFAVALMDFCVHSRVKEGYVLTESFEIRLLYPHAEIIAAAVATGTLIEVIVSIPDKPEKFANPEPLRRLLQNLQIGMSVEGGGRVFTGDPCWHSELPIFRAGFDPETQQARFSFVPYSTRHRGTFTFFLEGDEVGTHVQYFPPDSLYVR